MNSSFHMGVFRYAIIAAALQTFKGHDCGFSLGIALGALIFAMAERREEANHGDNA